MPMGLSGDRAGCAPPLGFSAQAGDFTGSWVCLSCAGFLISRLHQGSIVCGWYDDLGNDVCFCAGEALLTMQRGFEVAKQGGGNKGGDRKHQWGAETSTQPLAIMHDKPSPTRVVLGYVAIACTVISWLIYMITMILSLFVNNPSLTLRFVVESVLYMTIVTTLIFSALVYLATRQGALYRFIRHERVPRAMLDNHFAHNYGKGITVLIPSYVETAKSRRKNNLVGGIAGISRPCRRTAD